MTLAISTLTSSGIVLTADSRQTYRNQAGVIRIGSDSAMKLFKLTDSCGVAISGRAFLSENNQPPKDVGFFINRFAESEKLESLKIRDVGEKLNQYLAGIFVQTEMDALRKQINDHVIKVGGSGLKFLPPDGHQLPYFYKDKDGNAVKPTGAIETVHMIVAGIDNDDVGRAYSIVVPKGIIDEKDTQQCGAMWVGQIDVLLRIVLGFAPEIEALEFVKAALAADSAATTAQLRKLEYIINWGAITLQDAIDFCVLMTKTTESIQRFSDGTVLAPGGITGVGGETDVAVITAERGFVWLKQKALKSGEAELSLADCPRRNASKKE
jgi:hypothetical protein